MFWKDIVEKVKIINMLPVKHKCICVAFLTSCNISSLIVTTYVMNLS
jgi:hypothetical protein